MHVRVECYSGFKAEERPVCFYPEERKLLVEEVLDQWYGPDSVYFRVHADDGNVYVLRHRKSDSDDEWTLEAYRRGPDPLTPAT